MLFQTLVQLNILILATPALAGWTLLPAAHVHAFHAAGIVWQFRGAETAAPHAKAPAAARQAASIPAAAPRSVLMPMAPVAPTAAHAAALRLCSPLPHAARAP